MHRILESVDTNIFLLDFLTIYGLKPWYEVFLGVKAL